MKTFVITVLIFLIPINGAIAFEIDGLKSGMSIQESKMVLDKYSYGKIDVGKDYITAMDIPFTTSSARLISLSFCNKKLVTFQKDLKPCFEYFVRLVDEKRKQLGKPIDSWSNPTDITSNYESNSMTFLWKDGDFFISVTYNEFSSNNQLYIKYAIKNNCDKRLY